LDSLAFRIFGGYGHGERIKRMYEVSQVDSPAAYLGSDDAAIVFRNENKNVEFYAVGIKTDDTNPSSPAIMLAAMFVYAYASQKPEVINAMRLIKICFEEDMTKKITGENNVDNPDTNNK
jgi:hypothetical protein